MALLENTFSWSRSRAGTFERCARAYWWQYYGSWGGWDRQAEPEAREAYMLKNLSTRWAWAGTAVHEHIERILKRLQERGTSGRLDFEPEEVDEPFELDVLTRRMRDQYRQSREGRYREQPKRRFGLMEHEYDDTVSNEEWRGVNEKARAALSSFLRSDVFAHIRASEASLWFPIENLDQFDFEGTGVWAVPDFAMRTPDGGAEIYDWKTGAVKPENDRIQLACYTLYAEQKHGLDPSRVKNVLVYLGKEMEVHDFVLDAPALEAARETMRASIRSMRDKLSEPEKNRADREDFPLTDVTARCASCSYRRLCGRG